jgi:hypothetical protein
MNDSRTIPLKGGPPVPLVLHRFLHMSALNLPGRKEVVIIP